MRPWRRWVWELMGENWLRGGVRLGGCEAAQLRELEWFDRQQRRCVPAAGLAARQLAPRSAAGALTYHAFTPPPPCTPIFPPSRSSPQGDFFSLHTPLTPNTKGMFNDDQFAKVI